MLVIADLGESISYVLPFVLTGILGVIGLVSAGLSGLLITMSIDGLTSLLDRRIRNRFRFSNYVKTIAVVIGGMLSLAFWTGLYVYLFFSLSFGDFLKSLLVLLIPVLGACGILVIPAPEIPVLGIDLGDDIDLGDN